MERRLKERLTGAAVLITLAIIFIPMILDDTVHQDSRITETNIPPKPEPGQRSRIIPLEEPPLVVKTADAGDKADAQTSTPDEVGTDLRSVEKTDEKNGLVSEKPVTAAVTDGAEEPEVDSAGPARAADTRGISAWVIQLGSFSSRDNADSLVRQLRAEGYPAYVEETGVAAGIRYRVRVGPELLRPDADKLLETLNNKYELDGILLDYP